jgi:GTPase SAR1 family protein
MGAFFVFDLTVRSTFERLGDWLAELENNSGPNVIKFIVGNKKDLVDRPGSGARREVSSVDGRQMAESIGASYVEISALENNQDEVERLLFIPMVKGTSKLSIIFDSKTDFPPRQP